MATDTVLQVRMDSELRKQAEDLYSRLGISVAEAVRMFLVQSIEAQGLPFEVKTGIRSGRVLHAAGIAHKYADPSKIKLEKSAWAEAVKEKYADSGC